MGSNNCFVNMYYGLSEAQNWRVITKEERYEVLAFLRPWRKHNTSQHGSWSIKAVLPAVAPDLSGIM